MPNTADYQFRVDCSNGIEIHCHDFNNPKSQFHVKVFINKQKTESKLKWNYGESGLSYITEEIINTKDFELPIAYQIVNSGMSFIFNYKGFIPFIIEIYNNETQELLFTSKFECRNKLVNFTLDSDDPTTLHTWMCAIDKWKKEMGCQISIVNDYLKENQKYDFVDSYWKPEEEFNRYYAGFKIGRYGSDSAPNFHLNPDGTQNKNDLEIIEDILYYFTKML